jgi:hypothetical protein
VFVECLLEGMLEVGVVMYPLVDFQVGSGFSGVPSVPLSPRVFPH